MKLLLRTGMAATSLLLFCSFPAFSGEISPGLQAEMAAAAPDEEIPIIVEMTQQVQQQLYERMERRQLRKELVQAMRNKADNDQKTVRSLATQQGGKKIRPLWIINGLAIHARPALIEKLAKQPKVKEIRQDLPVPLISDTVSVTAENPWNLSLVGADLLWASGYGGQGVVVASMDSGVDYRHNQLSGNWRGGNNSWYDPNGEHALPYDADGHGTQTAGIMVGQNVGGVTIGMAPQAQWIAVKIFDDAGNGYTSSVHAGFQWLLDPDNNPNTDDAPDIINNSWGYPETENMCDLEFLNDFRTLENMGINVVFSAGNQGGSSSSISPANNPGIFSVGAIESSGFIASFSSQGPSACSSRDIFPTAVAPGVLVNTADLTFGLFNDATILATGTSFAAPHVSGAMALLLSAKTDLTPQELHGLLQNSAVDLGDAGSDYVYGYGLVDVAQALAMLGPIDPPPAPDPNPTPDPPPPNVCVDADGDGYFASDSCGTMVDCDDSNPLINPAGTEIAFDGIDQNCDGYDLTIEVTLAQYSVRRDYLTIQATSSLNDNGALQVDVPGIGAIPMLWNKRRGYWQLTVRSVSSGGIVPDGTTTLAVFGPEGSVTELITLR